MTISYANDKTAATARRVTSSSTRWATSAACPTALHLTYHESGFVQMLLVDSKDFNRNTYQFYYLRNDFLGTIPTVVFDVQPTKHNALGRFAGRIWVDRNSGNIVRFNGDFAGSTENQQFFHFDSWRTNVQEGLWMPTSVYIEETDPKSPTHSLQFKAVNYIWGYTLKLPAQGLRRDQPYG
jgi:hypothetical protein